MGMQEHIDIDLFKAVTRAITHSDSLDAMTAYLSQLLVASLGIKGCSVFAVNPETEELEILGSFGLSVRYLNKGPVLSKRSIVRTIKGEPVVISDIERVKTLQYPAEAKREGIRAIVSLPIKLYDRVFGALRLYHHEVWNPSSRDLDSLLVLTEVIGMAMVYMRLYNALRVIKDAAGDVHMVWMEPKSD
jgi:transcriptional regulator with GAF, ATPase, and Fis domain